MDAVATVTGQVKQMEETEDDIWAVFVHHMRAVGCKQYDTN